ASISVSSRSLLSSPSKMNNIFNAPNDNNQQNNNADARGYTANPFYNPMPEEVLERGRAILDTMPREFQRELGYIPRN
ncbi:hypothetical protein PMAYCL1PPCAC_32480, partial [Pristionchus mayeri]